MSEFQDALRAERTHLAGELPAAMAELPAAIAAADTANGAYREHLEARNRRGDHTVTEHGAALAAAATLTNNTAAELTRISERTRARIADIDRLLFAESDAANARAELGKAVAGLADAHARLAQLRGIETALQDELAGLAAKRTDAMTLHGKAELAARLAGRAAAAPKAIASLDADADARHAALDAARQAAVEIETELEAATAAADEARRRLRDALTRGMELRYYEALPAFLPILARVAASGSPIGASGGAGTFAIDLDAEVLQAAAAELAAETGGAE